MNKRKDICLKYPITNDKRCVPPEEVILQGNTTGTLILNVDIRPGVREIKCLSKGQTMLHLKTVSSDATIQFRTEFCLNLE